MAWIEQDTLHIVRPTQVDPPPQRLPGSSAVPPSCELPFFIQTGLRRADPRRDALPIRLILQVLCSPRTGSDASGGRIRTGGASSPRLRRGRAKRASLTMLAWAGSTQPVPRRERRRRREAVARGIRRQALCFRTGPAVAMGMGSLRCS